MSNKQEPPDESERIAGYAARAIFAPKTLLLGDVDPLRESTRENVGPNDYKPDVPNPSGKSPWRVFRHPIFWLVFLVLMGLASFALFRN